MSLSIPRLLKLALIVAVATAPWPLPRPEAPSAIAASTLRIGQLQDDSERLKRTGLEEAVRGRKPPATPNFESGLEEGALFTRWGRPIRLEPDLFDPNNDGAFKLLVLAWLMARPGTPDQGYDRVILQAIDAVIDHVWPLGNPANVGVVLKVWSVLRLPPPPDAEIAQRLAGKIKADILRAAEDPHDQLRLVRSKISDAAQILNSRRVGSSYPALVKPTHAALARIETVQGLLDRLRSDDRQARWDALRQLRRWLRWPSVRGVPDAVAWQAEALAGAVAALRHPGQGVNDPRVRERADQVARLMQRRQLGIAPERHAALDPAMILNRLRSLRAMAKAVEGLLIAGGFDPFEEAAAEILRDPEAVPAGFSAARELGALWKLGDNERGVAMRLWGPDRLALVVWTSRIARIIGEHQTLGKPLDAAALYARLAADVERSRKDLSAPVPPAEAVARRIQQRLVYWDSERAWPTPADR
ncbi:MAG: hypothetical protein HY600_05650, partial [Candidatus Omnitrophica bacterium]|nr:hypothetical protein [Candidatus Omnitrophota bacterium]